MLIEKIQNLLNKKKHICTYNEVNRNQWVQKYLEAIPAGKTLLDAGAGQQQYKKYCKHLNYVSQDFCQYDGVKEGNKTKGGLIDGTWDTSKIDIVSDITQIPVNAESFDYVLCTEVLEHLFEPNKAIKEFSRIIKKGGGLILTAPVCSLTHQVPYYYYNGYSVFWYKKILEENGFKIKEISANGNFFEYLIQELNRVDYCANQYAQKKLSHKAKLDITKVTNLLRKLSITSTNSEELLCFGWHLIAEKD